MVVLPAPESPVSATRRPGRMTALRRWGAHAPRAATERSSIRIVAVAREGTGAVPRSGMGVSRISKTAFAAATPLAEAWNWKPTCLRGLKTSGAIMMTSRPVARSRSPYRSRKPTSTAMIATDSVVMNSKTAPDRKATRRVDIVVAL